MTASTKARRRAADPELKSPRLTLRCSTCKKDWTSSELIAGRCPECVVADVAKPIVSQLIEREQKRLRYAAKGLIANPGNLEVSRKRLYEAIDKALGSPRDKKRVTELWSKHYGAAIEAATPKLKKRKIPELLVATDKVADAAAASGAHELGKTGNIILPKGRQLAKSAR